MIKLINAKNKAVRSAVAAGVLLGLISVAHAEAIIESVSSTIQGGVDVVRIDFSEPLKDVPAGFVVQSPARIALDFPGVRNGLGRNSVAINQGNVRAVNVVEANGRTRVVMNLKRATPYNPTIDGSSLFVSLIPEASDTATKASSSFAEGHNLNTAPLRDVDFRRGTDSAGRVVIDLDNNQVGVDIREQGGKLVVDFLKTSLPEGLRRKLDVADFGTPVQSITTVQNGDRVRMTIESKGQWEHSAYQSDNQLVIEVRQQKTSDGKLTQGQGYRGEKLSLNFQNIEVRSLLQVIADFTNFNIVTSDSVTGNVTLRLKDVPWDQALDIILQAKDLGMKKNGNVLQIAPKDELNAKEKAELEAQAAIQELEPLRTQAFQLNYAKAVDIVDQIERSRTSTGGVGNNNASRILSRRGSIIAEPRTNQIFVSDVSAHLAQVQELIAKLDVAVRQVLIEARIVEASDTFGRSLGVKLGGSDLRSVRGGTSGYGVGGSNRNRIAFGGTYNAVSATTGEGQSSMLTTSSTQFLNLPATAVSGNQPATFALSLFSAAANRFLNLELSAMEADGEGRIVSSPRVVTANQVEAHIKQGTEYAYQESAQNGATSVQFKEAVLSLKVTPQITPEGSIILDILVNKDSPGEVVAGSMSINTKEVKTQVLVENGGTVVIGGIFELTESESVAKVPLLGDIPVVGNLFKNRTKSSRKDEMLVFITPKIISEQASLQ